MGKPKHIRWINIAKLICILAVISQHAGLELALPYPLYRATELAVPTFFLLSGITLFLSCQRNAEKKIFPEIWRHCLSLLAPYALATAVYVVFNIIGFFDLMSFINAFLTFSASPQLYFSFIYLQFIIVAPFLYRLIRYYRNNYVALSLMLCATILFAYLSFNYSVMFNNIGGGARYLLGATFFPLFYIGMVFGSCMHRFDHRSLKANVVNICVSAALWGGWLALMCVDQYAMDQYLPFGDGRNPPSVSCFVFGLLTLYLMHSVGVTFEHTKSRALEKVIGWLSRFGKFTMYIYLFHWFALYRICIYLPIDSIHVKRLAYYALMIGLPVATQLIVQFVKRWFMRAMQPPMEKEAAQQSAAPSLPQ